MATYRATARDPFPLIEQHLRSAGFQILDRCHEDGPDPRAVIAADNGVLVACLVRARSGRSSCAAAVTISRTRARAVRRIAVAWMTSHGVRYEQVRIDIVAVTIDGPGGYTIEHVRAVGEP